MISDLFLVILTLATMALIGSLAYIISYLNRLDKFADGEDEEDPQAALPETSIPVLSRITGHFERSAKTRSELKRLESFQSRVNVYEKQEVAHLLEKEKLSRELERQLEETRQADLLLHVADGSSPEVDRQIAAVRSVLSELGVEETDTLLVLNKCDAVTDPVRLARLHDRYPHAVLISARSGDGIERLREKASEALARRFHDIDVELSPANGKLLAWLDAHGEVLSRRFDEERVVVHCRIPGSLVGRINPAEAIVRPHHVAPTEAVPSTPDMAAG